MSKTDKQIITLSIGFIATYLSVWIAGFYKHKLLNYISFLNVVSAIVLIGYWLQNQYSTEQHYYETRELIVLFFETFVVAISAYLFASASTSNWIKFLEYAVFALHFLALTLFLIFMLTFKMNKLF